MGGAKFGREMRLEGKHEGELAQARETIVRFLRKRFAPKSLRQIESALEAVDSLELLSELLDRAVDCNRLTEFRKVLPVPRDTAAHTTSEVKQQKTVDSRVADALSLLNLFSEMAYPRFNVAAIIGKDKLRESKFARSMRFEGQQEGRLEQARAGIIYFLHKRFGLKVLADIESTLAELDSLESLKALLDRAVDCCSLAAFRKEVPTPSRQR